MVSSQGPRSSSGWGHGRRVPTAQGEQSLLQAWDGGGVTHGEESLSVTLKSSEPLSRPSCTLSHLSSPVTGRCCDAGCTVSPTLLLPLFCPSGAGHGTLGSCSLPFVPDSGPPGWPSKGLYCCLSLLKLLFQGERPPGFYHR